MAYKVFTSDLRPPVQGGEPVWDGTLPYSLPPRDVDGSSQECAAGWNACKHAHVALRIAGLWPDGRPSRLFRVETDAQVVERGDKLRSSTWKIVEEIYDLAPILAELHAPFAQPLDQELVRETLLWREALARPLYDEAVVERGLTAALQGRGLGDWALRRFGAARAAWDARDALTVFVAARRGWIRRNADTLTVGIRDAYRHGLALAVPTGQGEFGWVMRDRP